MTTTLITGANKSLGYETSRRLIEGGHDVWMAARDEARGQKAAAELGGRFVQLDVTDDASVIAAAQTVAAAGGLDVLINNAGMSGGRVPVADVTPEGMRVIFETNVFGLVRVTQAFMPLLQKSDDPVIVMVSSGMGSIGRTRDPEHVESGFQNLGYSPSKAAVNMLMSQYSRAYPDIRINAVDPGYTKTDFNGNTGTQTVQEGTDAMVEAANFSASDPTGTFFARDGAVPW